MRTARHTNRVLVWRVTRRAIIIGGAFLPASLLVPSLVPAIASTAALSGVHVFGWGFSFPSAIASDGTHVWVANVESVTELSAKTGRLVKVISGSPYDFNTPDAIASDRTDMWVANDTGQSVTEFPALS
jgi:hypothetical protein